MNIKLVEIKIKNPHNLQKWMIKFDIINQEIRFLEICKAYFQFSEKIYILRRVEFKKIGPDLPLSKMLWNFNRFT